MYNEKYLKTKIKSYNGKINTNLYNNKVSKEGSWSICLSIILIDFVFRTGNNYYPQVFLEEYKLLLKKKDPWEYCWWFLMSQMKKKLLHLKHFE